MKPKTPTEKNVFFIPSGVPFLKALSQACLTGDLPVPGSPSPSRTDLPCWTILLPTRRATRALMQAFIGDGERAARLLPRILPLGDVDEDGLSLSEFSPISGIEPLPDAISELERQFILYDLIHKWVVDYSDNSLAKMLGESAFHAFDLAHSLASLLDSFETNNVDLALIEHLFEGEFAEHRQQILTFLAIIQNQLPEKITAMGKIGPSDRRNHLMAAYTQLLAAGNAQGPVIAAGSTGSIPATAELLSCIAGMPNGAVVLPGLDMTLDSESWDCLPEHHPQFGMRELLDKMQITRDQVTMLPGIIETTTSQAKNWLVSEIMRPAETTDQWRQAVTGSGKKISAATKEITILEAEDQREESLAIALVMRHGLESNKSVALVTPDRQLARGVKAELARWKIEIDDSAGDALIHSPHASFLRLLLEATNSGFSPVLLKSLLAHRFCSFATPVDQRTDLFGKFELALLRTDESYEGLAGLIELCEKQRKGQIDNTYAHPSFKRLDENDWQQIADFTQRINDTLQPLVDLSNKPAPQNLSNFISCHLKVAETISQIDDKPPVLWEDDEGEKLAELFSNLQAASHLAPPLTARDYKILLDQQLTKAIVRHRHVRHGSLAIYGLLEARLINADVVILGGLNETIWPPTAETDPWLTRPQMRNAGLPVPERRVGLSAHDFAQGFCSEKVFLTYSKKAGDSPAIPSRWILRLNALLKASGMENACRPTPQFPWLIWARQLDLPGTFEPTSRPAPTPPLDVRPVNFSVSGIATLMHDPYAFFADKILRLKPLNSLSYQAGAKERGNLVHAALHNFIQTYHDQLPENAPAVLMAELEKQCAQIIPDVTLRALWQPQLKRMAEWFIEQETLLRINRFASHTEISGQYTFKISDIQYSLTARADRLDILNNNTILVIDYKTGTVPEFRETNKSYSPQLLLEAVICEQGGFPEIPATSVSGLAYMKLSGGIPAGELKTSPDELKDLITKAQNGVKSLLSCYHDANQPYLARSEPIRDDFEYDYDYLSRWREWAHLTDGSGSA